MLSSFIFKNPKRLFVNFSDRELQSTAHKEETLCRNAADSKGSYAEEEEKLKEGQLFIGIGQKVTRFLRGPECGALGAVGSAERTRTRQHFDERAGLACSAARSLPAVCTLARLQSAAEHRESHERDTMNALVQGQIDKDRDTEPAGECVSEGGDVSEGLKTGDELEILMERIRELVGWHVYRFTQRF